ncbi:SCO-spondin-like [Dreissena polymorpha]|uniref:SCO-spondin-like n=1 Tax=Dreissena polymorpha TaxID=45954 RepID=UPI002264D398|nr:SCO-spondin-like [Dreissena polymorpha]
MKDLHFELYKMDTLRMMVIIILLMIFINLMSCFKIKKSLWSLCPQSQGRIRTFFDISIDDCVKECLNRPLCKALGHRRYMNVCELFSTDETEDDNTCITVRKEDIEKEQGEVPCNCQNGQTCDTATKECVRNECEAFSKLEHGRVLGNMYHIGAQLAFKCDPGWVEKNMKSNMRCLQNGSWSYRPACVAINQPIDGQWSMWQAWQGCSVTCRDGVRIRNRACDAPKPEFGGNPCSGEGSDEEPCTGSGSCPAACPAGSESFHENSTHLFVTSTKVNYSMAQELCQSKKGQLSRIDSEEMKIFVAKHLNGNV